MEFGMCDRSFKIFFTAEGAEGAEEERIERSLQFMGGLVYYSRICRTDIDFLRFFLPQRAQRAQRKRG
ncbi:MAG: hypothetical protein EAZ60_18680 [Oscillatoriales cyanobacterium]|nr:MAG: hypothetical protein EAZ79_10995 [Oscillatoriales cyanobacterium]TAF20068.1 MAG: hypothetical protein EAZ73_13065 [Oscillatoriales cyanobacterium]TAF30696.1 MAG: hypothetical protein EAZ69_21510 [Oscillatoriales cyanobacterium]TAF53860.1 MAG: hypothetical protein EAZ60_18680 [Oscillatoriales cyanobacterium]